MTEHVYKYLEIVGTSADGNDAAIKAALKRVCETVRNVRWYEVMAQRGFINPDGSIQYQVTLKVGFSLED